MAQKQEKPESRDLQVILGSLQKAETDAEYQRKVAEQADKEVAGLRVELSRALKVISPGAVSMILAALGGAEEKPKRGRRRKKDFSRQDRVIDMLGKHGGILTIGEFRQAERCSYGAAAGVFRRLMKDGKITRLSRSRYSLATTNGAAP